MKTTIKKWLGAGGIATAALLALLGTEQAMAGTYTGGPGTPTVVWKEDFQNTTAPTGTESTVVLLPAYTGLSGMKYTADPAWIAADINPVDPTTRQGRSCNGLIVAGAMNPANPQGTLLCNSDQSAWNQVQRQAYALALLNNQTSPNTNYALSEYTHASHPDPTNLTASTKILFETTSPVTLTGTGGRFLTSSIDVANNNCYASGSLLNFFLVLGGAEQSLNTTPVDTCLTGTELSNVPAIGSANTPIKVGHQYSARSYYTAATTVGYRVRNASGTGAGNDMAVDNAQILDATPTLRKDFVPTSVAAGSNSVMTFTIVNTADFASKVGWTFTDTLPTGLTIAGAATTDCGTGTVVTAVSGSNKIDVTAGNLPTGSATNYTCTVSVPVTSATAGTYTNAATNVSNLVGLINGANAVLTVAGPTITQVKIADKQVAAAGDSVRFTLASTNTGAAPSTLPTVIEDIIPVGLTINTMTGINGYNCVASSPLPLVGNGTTSKVTCTATAVAIPPMAANFGTVILNATKTIPGTVTNTSKMAQGDSACPAATRCAATATVRGTSAITMVKIVDKTSAIAGEDVKFTIASTNNSTDPSSLPTVIEDVIPVGLTVKTIVGINGYNCVPSSALPLVGNGTTSKVTCTATAVAIPPMAANFGTMILTATKTIAGTVINTAKMTQGSITCPADAGCTATATVRGTPTIKILKTVDKSSAAAGEDVKFTIVSTNTSTDPSSLPTVIEDVIPVGLTVKTITGINGYNCVPSSALPLVGNGTTSKVTCTATAVAIPPMAENFGTVILVATKTTDNTVTNVAKMTQGQATCPAAADCSGTAVVKGGATLTLFKTADKTEVQTGGTANFTIGVNNASDTASVVPVEVVDTLPVGLTVSSAANVVGQNGFTCVSSTGSYPLVGNGSTSKIICTSASTAIPANIKNYSTATIAAVSTALNRVENIANVTKGDPACTVATPAARCTATVALGYQQPSSFNVRVTKTANVSVAYVGDIVRYAVTIYNDTQAPISNASVMDVLPLGFTYVDNTATIGGAYIAEPVGKPGANLSFTIPGTIPAGSSITLNYAVRVGVGAERGTGINNASVNINGVKASAQVQAKVLVRSAFGQETSCILGNIYSDTNANSIKDRGEFGLPGVRFYMDDGTSVVSDDNGNYSLCGISAASHVLAVDKNTLPRDCQLLTTNNRNLGDAASLWIDAKAGELGRGDFICKLAPPPAPPRPDVIVPPRPTPKPIQYRRILLEADALFKFDKYKQQDMLPGGVPKLNALADALLRSKNIEHIELVGHTDRLASDAYNMRLGQNRANTIKAYLAAKGIPAAKMTATTRGEHVPLVFCNQKNEAALISCLQPNRRVEVNTWAEIIEEMR